MRRLAFIVIFLVGTVGAFAWLSQGFSSSWEPRLRLYLEETAGRLTQTRVQIDGIMPVAVHRVRLLNVRVTDPKDSIHPLFQASDIELTVSLIDLPRALLLRRPYEAIGLISINNPWVRLSQETLAKFTSRGSSGSSLPPWFTLAWEGGTLQWVEPTAPHGAWTLYQTQGSFRIRGPQMSFSLRGSVPEAHSVQFQFSSLVHHWNARLRVSEGQCQSVLDLIERLVKRPLLPAGWAIPGKFQFEAMASGRRWPAAGERLEHFLDRATLTFLPPPSVRKLEIPSLALSGTLTYQGERITSSHLAFDCPWLQGTGRTTLSIEGTRTNPLLMIDAAIPSGRIGRWAFQDAVIQMRYISGHWEFLQAAFQFLGGRVTAKGTVARAGSDMSITADHVSLAALGQEGGIKFPEGSLNVSCAFKGPFEDWQIAGAWWLSGVDWGKIPMGEARGDFEVTPESFRAQAKSESSRFRLALDGTQNDKKIQIDQLEIMLPSGATFTSEAQWNRLNQQIQGTLGASKVSFPSDLPFFPINNWPVKGTLDAQARFSGTVENPTLKVSLQSGDATAWNQTLGNVSAGILWNKSHFEIPKFRIDPGINGSYKNGLGTVSLRNTTIGKWAFEQGALRFGLKPEHLEISELTLQTQDTAITAQGKIAWEKNDRAPTKVSLEGRGDMTPKRSPNSWDVPFDMTGHFINKEHAWEGGIQFGAHMLEGLMRGAYSLSGPSEHSEGIFTAHLENARWRAFQFSTDLDGRWSGDGLKPLTLKGRFKNGGDFQFSGLLTPEAQAQGTLKLQSLNLRPLGESLRFPKPLEGSATATLTLSGPLSRLKWNGHLEGGPVIYASTSEHPFKVEQVAMDMTLSQLDNDPSIYRLTLTESQFKTTEELIRFRPGSFVEFAGQKPSRLVLGTDLRNLHFGIFTLFGGLDMDGTWQIKPEGFAIQSRAQTHSLFINDYELEEGLLLMDYYNGVLKFSVPPNLPPLATGVIDFHKAPQIKFTNFFISGKDRQGLELSGDVGPSLWDFQMAGRGLDMGILGELAGFPYPLSGAADVQVHGTGDPKHPHVDGKVNLDRGNVMGLSFRSGSAAFIWQDARISFTKLVLSDPGHYILEGAGVFPLISKDKSQGLDHSIDFSIRLRDANLSLLQSFSQEVKQAKGPVEGLIQIKGTLEDPDLHGSLKVSNGEILGAHYFRQLRGANLTLDFDGDAVTIRELRGKSGDGEFRASGTIKLSGFLPSNYDVKLEVVSSKGVDVQIPELAIPDSPLAKRFKFLTSASRGDVRGHVALRGPAEAPVFSGEGFISNGHFTFPPSHKNPPSAAVLEWFRRITWDVHLNFSDGAWFDNELVQAGVIGNLNLKGPSDKLHVDGSLDINEGKISYLGLQFDIQQARFDIRSETSGDAVVNTPYLRGVAECQTQAVDTVSGVAGASGGSRLSVNDTITLNIDYAPVDQIKPRLTSAANPTLSQDKLLARVTQTDIENLTPQERNYLYQKQIVSLIDTSLTTPLAQNVLKKTGIADRVRVQHIFDPNAVTGQDLNTTAASQQQSTAVNLFANTKYTIEKDISNRLSVGYGVRFVPSATTVDPELQQQQKLDLISDVQLSYRWFKNLYLRGDFDLPSSNTGILPERKVTIEPRWRFGWWGNTNKDKEKPKPSH